MKVGPRYKICKRLGSNVFEKCQTQKFTISESRRSSRRKRPRALSDYGKQLLEKQRVRFMYGITEKQFSNYVHTAEDKQGDRAAHLFTLLESRLDNVIYRIGFAPTRRAARQLVAHGHFYVNGKKVTVPSYSLKVGDAILLREKSKKAPIFDILSDQVKETSAPPWIIRDVKKIEGKMKQLPTKDTVETTFDLTTVMEFYSR